MIKSLSLTSESTLVGLAVAVLVAIGNWAQSGQPLTWTTLIAFLVPAVLNYVTSTQRLNQPAPTPVPTPTEPQPPAAQG